MVPERVLPVAVGRRYLRGELFNAPVVAHQPQRHQTALGLFEEGVRRLTLGALTEGDAVAADVVPLVLMTEHERAEGEAADAFLVEAESCFVALRRMRIDRRVKELAAEKAAAERAGDDERLARLVMEDLELKRSLTTLASGVTGGGRFD